MRGNEEKVRGFLPLPETARAGMLSAGPARSGVGTAGADEPLAIALARLNELFAKGRYSGARYLYLRGRKDHAKTRDLLLALRNDFPSTRFAHAALYELAAAHLGLKEETAAREPLDRCLAESKGPWAAAEA